MDALTGWIPGWVMTVGYVLTGLLAVGFVVRLAVGGWIRGRDTAAALEDADREAKLRQWVARRKASLKSRRKGPFGGPDETGEVEWKYGPPT